MFRGSNDRQPLPKKLAERYVYSIFFRSSYNAEQRLPQKSVRIVFHKYAAGPAANALRVPLFVSFYLLYARVAQIFQCNIMNLSGFINPYILCCCAWMLNAKKKEKKECSYMEGRKQSERLNIEKTNCMSEAVRATWHCGVNSFCKGSREREAPLKHMEYINIFFIQQCLMIWNSIYFFLDAVAMARIFVFVFFRTRRTHLWARCFRCKIKLIWNKKKMLHITAYQLLHTLQAWQMSSCIVKKLAAMHD